MSFGHPLLLLTLLIVPAAILAFRLAERRRMRYAVRFTNLDVLAGVARGGAWRRFVPLALFLAALATLCVGVARPHATTRVPEERATVILVLDVSRSMDARDVKPTRLLAAEAAVRTFLEHVPKSLRVGLIAFAGFPNTVVAPTRDHELVRDGLVDIADYGGYGGTALGDALAAAVALGQQAVSGDNGLAAATAASPTHGLVSILFLSDGAQTRGDLLPLQGAERAKAAGIPVYTVALGTPNGTLDRRGFPGGGFGSGGVGGGGTGGGGYGFGSGNRVPVPPDPETLRSIAVTTGGQFFAAKSSKSLNTAYAKLGSKLGRKASKTEVTYAFLAGAAGLLIAAGLLSGAWSPRLP
jgi:Ca-activated chloride channel family protein